MSKPTQCDQILAALEGGCTLTVLDALRDFGCYALSQRCGELKKKGHDIKSEPFSYTTSYGEKKTIAKYSMAPKAGQTEML